MASLLTQSDTDSERRSRPAHHPLRTLRPSSCEVSAGPRARGFTGVLSAAKRYLPGAVAYLGVGAPGTIRTARSLASAPPPAYPRPSCNCPKLTPMKRAEQ